MNQVQSRLLQPVKMKTIALKAWHQLDARTWLKPILRSHASSQPFLPSVAQSPHGRVGLVIWFNSNHDKTKTIHDSQREPGDTSPMSTMLNILHWSATLQEEPNDSPPVAVPPPSAPHRPGPRWSWGVGQMLKDLKHPQTMLNSSTFIEHIFFHSKWSLYWFQRSPGRSASPKKAVGCRPFDETLKSKNSLLTLIVSGHHHSPPRRMASREASSWTSPCISHLPWTEYSGEYVELLISCRENRNTCAFK